MYNEDIDGSIAHVTMLGKQGIVSEEEKEKIIAGLEEIRKDIADGKIVFTVEDEDIHMGIESRLIQRIGGCPSVPEKGDLRDPEQPLLS